MAAGVTTVKRRCSLKTRNILKCKRSWRLESTLDFKLMCIVISDWLKNYIHFGMDGKNK